MAAAALFLDRTERQIEKICLNTLIAHQNALLATMTAEEIQKNKAALSEKFLDSVSWACAKLEREYRYYATFSRLTFEMNQIPNFDLKLLKSTNLYLRNYIQG